MAGPLPLLLLGLLPGMSLADGGFVGNPGLARAAGLSGVASTQQKAIMIELPEGREVLLLQTTYHGPAEDFAWIIPVPGRPERDDVFEASPRYMDWIFAATRPRVATTINGQPLSLAGSHGGLGGGGLGAEPVIVHERMTVGIYDVTILSATRLNVLADWLSERHYELPEGSDPILDAYVLKRWYFVALKIEPKATGGPRVLSDVQPIGIRFDTEELVYPLTISRISSRENTALLLIALTEADVECDQLPEIELPLARPLPPVTCYATVRRELVAAGPPGLIREYCGPYAAPRSESEYEKQAEARPLGTRPDRETWMQATRWWTLLDRDAMTDLTFSPREGRPARALLIDRAAHVEFGHRERVRYARGLGLGEALGRLDDMLLRFRRQYGCLPASLQDLAGLDLPETGVDSSGNPIPLPTAVQWHRPLGATPVARGLPTDPLTGRNDTWLYEPTGEPVVESGAYATTLYHEALPPPPSVPRSRAEG